MLLIASEALPAYSSGSAATRKVLIVGREGELPAVRELEQVLGAHLADLDVGVQVVVVARSAEEIFARDASVREFVRSRGALAAIWVEQPSNELYVFISDGNTERMIARARKLEHESWAVNCDTIAAMVRSALVTWLDIDPPPAAEEPDETPAPSERRSLKFAAQVAYRLAWVHLEQPPTNSLLLALGLLFENGIEVGVTAGFLGRGDLTNTSEKVQFRHIPLTVGAAWVWSAGAFQLGLRGALALDFTYLQGSAVQEAADKTSHVHLGFSPTLIGRYLFYRPLVLYAEAGADLYPRPYTYEWWDQTAFEYAHFQPRIAVGVGLLL